MSAMSNMPRKRSIRQRKYKLQAQVPLWSEAVIHSGTAGLVEKLESEKFFTVKINRGVFVKQLSDLFHLVDQHKKAELAYIEQGNLPKIERIISACAELVKALSEPNRNSSDLAFAIRNRRLCDSVRSVGELRDLLGNLSALCVEIAQREPDREYKQNPQALHDVISRLVTIWQVHSGKEWRFNFARPGNIFKNAGMRFIEDCVSAILPDADIGAVEHSLKRLSKNRSSAS